MQESACLVVNAMIVYSYDIVFSCTTVGQASDSTLNIYRSVVARCLSFAGPTVAQLEVFFSSDYGPWAFHHSVLYAMIHCNS